MIPKCCTFSTHAYSDLAARAASELARNGADVHPRARDGCRRERTARQMGSGGERLSENSGAKSALSGRFIFAWRGCILSKPNPPSDFAEQAKKELQQELEIDPANAGAEYVLGELARQAQDLPEAVKHFTKATELEANFADAYLGLGMSLLAREELRRGCRSAGKGSQTCSPRTPQGTTAWPPHTRVPDARKMRSANLPCSRRPREPDPDREPRTPQ